MGETQADGAIASPLRIAVFQGEAIPLEIDHNLALLDSAASAAEVGGADVLVTPELFATGYVPARIAAEVSPERVLDIESALRNIARRRGVAMVYSTPGRGAAEGRGITATLTDGEGRIVGTYIKSHLFGAEESAAFTAGTLPPTVVTFGGLRMALAICYDVEFPEVVRTAALAGAQVLLVPTAVGAGHENVSLVLIPARALENSLTVAYANHSGSEAGFAFSGTSVIADAHGNISARAGTGSTVIFADASGEIPEVDYLADRRPRLYADWLAEF